MSTTRHHVGPTMGRDLNMWRVWLRPSNILMLLRHVRFTLNFHFNSFSSALLSCDLSSCDSSHDPFHLFTYHMTTPTFLSHMTHCFPLWVIPLPLRVPTWVPMTLVIVCFTYYLWLTVIPYESLYCVTYDSAGNTCPYDSLLLYCTLIIRHSSVVLKSSSLGTL